MGRLTLNVLLSFAQFEREVTGERIRDKIAASRRKGMWMGGTIPLGYDVKDRKLVINAAAADTVRHIMRRYLELGSVRALMEDLRTAGIRTKRQALKHGGTRGGLSFARGPLYHLLKNRIYVGEIPHHDNWYPGEHQAIVEPELFDQVQALLARNAAEQQRGDRAVHPSLLAGLIRDAQDRPMSPSHANKPVLSGVEGAGRRYRYYVSNEAVPTDGTSGNRVMRLPAAETERAVIDAVSATLAQAQPIRDRWTSLDARTADRGERNCRMLAARLRKAKVGEARSLLQQLDLQIVVEEERILASCSMVRLLALVEVPQDTIEERARLPISIPTRIRRRGQELRLLFNNPASKLAKRDPHLIGLLVKAHDAKRQLTELGPVADNGHRRELLRFARLSYLAPDIIAAILEGRQPEDLGTRQLLRTTGLPLCWNEQRRLLGFA
jgi:hypothetical protein